MWMVNKMRWLPYGATTKRTDNAETLFGNLKNWRRKMDEKWKCVKNRHDVHFWKMDVFQSFFTSFLAPFFIPFFWKMKSKMRSKMDQKWELWTPLFYTCADVSLPAQTPLSWWRWPDASSSGNVIDHGDAALAQWKALVISSSRRSWWFLGGFLALI